MREAEILSLAEMLVEEYASLLHIDPYFKIHVEVTDLIKISDCMDTDAPATWKLRINPTQHVDEIDIQMSVISAVLTVLFRDIQPSKKLDEARSKLTHAFVQISAHDQESDIESDQPAED